MRKIDETLNTNGVGFWSKEAREVRIIGLSMSSYPVNDEGEPLRLVGELRVKFDLSTWNPEKHGLIYTDKGFIVELEDFLKRAQYDTSDIGYSEMGMQGDDYVSLDVGQNFINSWNATK